MTEPPVKKVSREELHRIFDTDGWQKRVSACTRIDFYERPTPNNPGTSTVGYLYKENGVEIALIFHFKRPDGTLTDPSPRRLLKDGTWHYCV